MINMQKKKKAETQSLPISVIPADAPAPDVFLDNLFRVVGNFGFQQILLPALEEKKLFFKDKELARLYGGDLLASGLEDWVLPPTQIFSAARRYAQNVRKQGPHVSKWFYLSPVVRVVGGKPATGHELGLCVLGEDSPAATTQLINTTAEIFRELGISEFMIELNSLGCRLCQKNYGALLESHLASSAGSLCEDCETDLEKNPIAILRCAEPACQQAVTSAPQIVDALDDHCKAALMGVLENIDDLGIPYTLNPVLNPPLLQEKTVFSIASPAAANSFIGHGGNYSLWSALAGSPETVPIIGFLTTFEKLMNAVPEERRRTGPRVEVFMVPLGLIAMRKAMVLHRDLVASGIAAAEAIVGNSSIKNQLKEAVAKKCEIALIIGQKEALDETVIMRDMRSGMQEVFALDRIIEEVKKRLGK